MLSRNLDREAALLQSGVGGLRRLIPDALIHALDILAHAAA